MKQALRDWRVGDPFSASHLQEVVTFAKGVGDIVGGDGVGVVNGPNGTVINLLHSQMVAKPIPCIIVAPPGGQTAYADERYYCRREVNVPESGSDGRTRLKLRPVIVREDDPYECAFVASNLCEREQGTHVLPVGSRVLVWRIETRGRNAESVTDAHEFYVFENPSIGVPQYVGMTYQGTAQNYAGWDYVRAHAMTN